MKPSDPEHPDRASSYIGSIWSIQNGLIILDCDGLCMNIEVDKIDKMRKAHIKETFDNTPNFEDKYKKKLPNNLKLFLADVIDDDTTEQEFYYVTDKDYDSALVQFKKFADKCFYRYSYYFYEVEDADEIEEFMEYFESSNEIKADIYEK